MTIIIIIFDSPIIQYLCVLLKYGPVHLKKSILNLLINFVVEQLGMDIYNQI
jgi:hypothetical protein